MSEDQIKDYFEDNGLKDHLDNRIELLKHFKCFNLLHHIYDIANQLSLYHNIYSPTPYRPLEPPRTFSTPFPDLSYVWELARQDIETCFAYAPGKPQNPRPSKGYDPFDQTWNPYTQSYNVITLQNALNVFKECGRKFHNEIWLEFDGVLHSYTPKLALYLHSPFTMNRGYRNNPQLLRYTDILDRLRDISSEIPDL